MLVISNLDENLTAVKPSRLCAAALYAAYVTLLCQKGQGQGGEYPLDVERTLGYHPEVLAPLSHRLIVRHDEVTGVKTLTPQLADLLGLSGSQPFLSQQNEQDADAPSWASQNELELFVQPDAEDDVATPIWAA
eukprot:275203_1